MRILFDEMVSLQNGDSVRLVRDPDLRAVVMRVDGTEEIHGVTVVNDGGKFDDIIVPEEVGPLGFYDIQPDEPIADIRFPKDVGPFGVPMAPAKGPVKPIPHDWSDATFTTEITCNHCGTVTPTSGQWVRVTDRMVFMPSTCQGCRRSGEVGIDREEFQRWFPDAKL